MNINNIKKIIDSPFPDEIKERMIIAELSEDEKVIPMLLQILDNERNTKQKIHDEMNLLLGKACIGLENKKINKDGFMQKQIKEFYEKHRGVVGDCFNILKSK